MATCKHRIPASDRNRDVIDEVAAKYGYSTLNKALTHIVDVYLKYKDVDELEEKEVEVEVLNDEEYEWDHRAYLDSISIDNKKSMKIVHLH